MFLRTAALTMAAAALAGCMSPMQRAQRDCANVSGNAWEQCMNLAVQAEEADQARGDAMIGAGLGMLAQPQPPPVVCTTNPYGSWSTPVATVCH